MESRRWTTGIDTSQIETVVLVSPRGDVSCVVTTPRETYDAFDPVKAAAFLAGMGQKEVARRFGNEVLREVLQAVKRASGS